jgi:hypothetical protein
VTEPAEQELHHPDTAPVTENRPTGDAERLAGSEPGWHRDNPGPHESER